MQSKVTAKEHDVCIIGGAGHVGLPLALIFADKGLKVNILDINAAAIETIKSGKMPFIEYEAEPILKAALASQKLSFTSELKSVTTAKYVIITLGTPVDEYMNPKLKAMLEIFSNLRSYLTPDQTIIIRSTVYPRTCRQILRELQRSSSSEEHWKIAYCPERIAQGYAIRELKTLPQIVSGLTPEALKSATELFTLIAPRIIELEVEEAELNKLFSNAWRYIQFAAANQFYMIADSLGVDFNKVRKSMMDGYGRAASLPSAGFAAGPCLLKDTMQLAAFNNNNFQLGQAAVLVNEGLPGFLVENLRKKYDLSKLKVGILGMAFKADIDDVRDALSYKLGKILRFHGASVFYTDEFAEDPTFISKEELISTCEVVIVGVPHTAYKNLVFPKHVEVVDVWGSIQPRE